MMNNQSPDIKIAAAARQYPGRIAVKAGNQSISYLQLENRSNRIANFLHDKLKDSENKNVVVILDRSPELVESVVGLLKAGLIFVPVDPLLPTARVRAVFQQVRPRWLITSGQYYDRFKVIGSAEKSDINILLIDGKRESNTTAYTFCLPAGKGDESLQFQRTYSKNCYLYFTSGSTGVPRGVLGRRRSLAHFIEWEIKEFGIDENFKVSQFTPPAFDPFLRDVLVPLRAGATCCIPDYETLTTPGRLIRWIDKYEINLLHIVPSLFKALVPEINSPNCFFHLKYILLAGELLRGNDIARFIEIFDDRIQLVNMYGPTETTLAKLFYRIKKEDAHKPIIPVGKPIEGARVMILDSNKQKCRKGSRGEIYIRTPFISSGYYNAPDLNRERFIKNPYGENPGDIIFKSGDLGRLFPDGNLELSGRVDHQVKIRGYRVELGEIENLLLKHRHIKDAVVIARENEKGEKSLCAYIVTDRDLAPYVPGIRRDLSAELPHYMVPSYFIRLEEVPLTPNGKIDRQALPVPVIKPALDYAAPRDEIEKKLAAIWAEILGVPGNIVGIDADFFELGGHSLKASLLVSEMQKVFNVRIPLAKLFNSPYIRELSGYIKGAEQNSFISLEMVEKREYYRISSNQKRLWLIRQMDPTSPSYNIYRIIPLEHRVNREILEKVFCRLTERHESLRTCFREVEDEPVQFIKNEVDFPLEVIDISRCREKEQQGKTLIDELLVAPFDLAVPPLARAVLVKYGEEEYTVGISMHHIISDAWSMEILKKEFYRLYEGYRGKKEVELSLPDFQYKDFAAWHNRQLNHPHVREKSHRFWLEKLGDREGLARVELSRNFNEDIENKESAAYQCVMDGKQKEKLGRLARDHHATLFTVMFSIFNMILANFSGQRDIVCGIPAGGRGHVSLQNIVGFFVNTLVLKTHIKHNETFTSLIKRVNRDNLEALQHQDYPLEQVLDDLHMKFPRISVFFNMLNIPGTTERQELDHRKSIHREKVREVKFDMVLYSTEYKNTIELQCHYRKALFNPEVIEHMIGEYIKLLNFVGDNPAGNMKDYKRTRQKRVLRRGN